MISVASLMRDIQVTHTEKFNKIKPISAKPLHPDEPIDVYEDTRIPIVARNTFQCRLEWSTRVELRDQSTMEDARRSAALKMHRHIYGDVRNAISECAEVLQLVDESLGCWNEDAVRRMRKGLTVLQRAERAFHS